MNIIITGKSGSGKTYIAEKLAIYLNAKLISFDEISHKILEIPEIIDQLNDKFDSTIFDNGILNRKKLGEIVFNDLNKLEFLNNLVQKYMEIEIDSILSKNEYNYYILDYALLPKMKYFSAKSFKILIKSNHLTRKTRIINRDNISSEYFMIRENNSLEYNDNDYDFVINNNENVNFDELFKKIKEKLC